MNLLYDANISYDTQFWTYDGYSKIPAVGMGFEVFLQRDPKVKLVDPLPAGFMGDKYRCVFNGDSVN